MADRLGMIMSNTLKAIESGKEEIFLIAESARAETQRLTNELENLKDELFKTIEEVDKYEQMDRRLRHRLMIVSRDYTDYTEKEVMDIYTKAKDVQTQLKILQSQELQLRSRRDDLERSLRQMESTIERAENLLNQVSLAISLLHGGLTELAQGNNQPEKQKDTALKILLAQDKERRRIAREIHDGPAQNLANIVLRLEIAEKLMAIDTSKVQAEIADLKGLVRSNLRDIRRIIFDLRPIAFDGNGLLSSLEKYLVSFQDNYKIKCELHVKGEEKQLLPVIEVSIFRSLQECLTNIAKHSLSDWAGIEIDFQENAVFLEIKDRGIGFDLNKVLENPGEHYGLIGVKERIEMLNGKIDIDSVLEKGTTIKFHIPIDQKEGLS